jgi:hypothetical protein
LNAYTTEFFMNCPNNGLRVKYRLRIETHEMIPVEQITAKVESLSEGFHEEVADEFLFSFGGAQTLTADHHGVTIETTRGVSLPSNVNSTTP